MNTIVFDIETVARPIEEFDEAQRDYLTKYCKDEKEKEDVLDQMALWAPTNQIVAIGMLSVESDKGAVYFSANDKKLDFEEGNIKYWSGTEKEILEKFWQAIAFAQRFVTFNGRGFDCPVLMTRSAILKVKPSKNLMPNRYNADWHVDLLDQLTFYSAIRKFNLDFFCKAFGIQSPKAAGVDGHMVKPMFTNGQYEDIARYCAGDLGATKELYLRWNEYIKI